MTKDLSALEKISSYKVEKLQAAVEASQDRTKEAEKKCYENHLMHQVSHYSNKGRRKKNNSSLLFKYPL